MIERETKIQFNPGRSWVITNAIGFLLVNINLLFLVFNPLMDDRLNGPWVVLNSLSTGISAGLLLGTCHYVYFRGLRLNHVAWCWAVKTGLAVLLVYLVNSEVISVLAFEWLFPTLGQYFQMSGWTLFPYSGVLGGLELSLPNILIAAFSGVGMGLAAGGILGFIQASEFKVRGAARAWLVTVTSLYTLAFLINSIFFSVVQPWLRITSPMLIMILQMLIVGLFYGLGTKKLMVDYIRLIKP